MSLFSQSIRLHLMAGLLITIVLAGGVGGWAATAELASALIAQGSVVVESNVKKVQHPTGGIVGEVRVRDGDRVKEGDVLVRLDETVTRANLSIIVKSLNELLARKARLESERDGLEGVIFPEELLRRVSEVDIRRILDSERKLFDFRRASRSGLKAQLRQRIAQLNQEINGLDAQQNAKGREIILINRELDGVKELYQKNLIQLTRLTALEREATRLEGERAQMISSIAQVRGRIAEFELQVIQIDQDLSSEVAKELRDIDAKIGEFVERKVTAEDHLRRIEIRAPQDGIIFQSTVHTVGGVVSNTEPLMLIVPEADNLLVEAKINPQDIDQLQLGQAATIRFPSFNQQTTPAINGVVSRISADTSLDPRTGLTFYTARVTLPPKELARLGTVRLLPGMPVEVFVQTGQRTMLSYLMKPLSDQFHRALRER